MIRLFILSFLISVSGFTCTTIIVTKGASSDGSVMVLHTDDNELADQRIVFIPSADNDAGEKRAVYPYVETGPRYVGKSRGPAYNLEDGIAPTKPLGYIDQVSHTYSYFEGGYPIINEHQLAMGETSCASYYDYDQDPQKRLFDISALARVAMERCKTAREAIALMGDLAERYGYYGWGGEMLTIVDTEEGWVFEICGTPSGKGALWVAKKVPDGEIFVAANEFRIREIDPKDSDILYSKNLFSVAQDKKWWNPKNPDKKLDWLKSVSPGEYYHPYYSLRRVWRLQSKLAPSKELSPWVEDGYTKEYPFSIKPEKKLSVIDLANLIRDHYEGTEFDLTKGIASGPFGNPQRYFGPYDSKMNTPDSTGKKIDGAWERPISMYYCGHTWICQSRGHLPDPIGGVAWIGLDAPASSCFVPFYCGMDDLPQSYQRGSTSNFTRNSAWWAFNFVSNYATIKYSYMIKDIQNKQKEIEERELSFQKSIEQQAHIQYLKNPADAKRLLTKYSILQANRVTNDWWELTKYLIEKYNDGFINKPKMAQEVGYPKIWRDEVGYKKGPTSYNKE